MHNKDNEYIVNFIIILPKLFINILKEVKIEIYKENLAVHKCLFDSSSLLFFRKTLGR